MMTSSKTETTTTAIQKNSKEDVLPLQIVREAGASRDKGILTPFCHFTTEADSIIVQSPYQHSCLLPFLHIMNENNTMAAFESSGLSWPDYRRSLYGIKVDNEEPYFEIWWAPEEHGESPLADWKITVESEQTIRTFYVHTPVLKCKSEYFRGLLDGGFLGSKVGNTTHIQFPEAVARNFDAFLDCMYMKGFFQRRRHVKAEQLFSLLVLLDFFGVDPLFTQLQRHVQLMTHPGCWLNCASAILFERECGITPYWDKIVGAFTSPPVNGSFHRRSRWRSRFRYDMTDALALIGLDGFIELLQHIKRRDKADEYLPDLVANACELCFTDIGVEIFLEITHPEILPKMELFGAMHLYRLASKFEVDATDDSLDALSRLKHRCIDTVYEDLLHKETLDICECKDFRRGIDSVMLQIIAQRCFKECMPDEWVRMLKTEHLLSKWEILQSCLHHAKVSNQASAPIKLYDHGWNWFEGTYIRKGDYYVKKYPRDDNGEVRVQKSEDGESWEICRIAEGGNIVRLKTPIASETTAYPPFKGWMDAMVNWRVSYWTFKL